MARQSRPAREMDYCAAITTEPAAAKEVRVFGLGDFFLQRFRERLAVALGEVNRVRLARLKVSTIFSGAYALVLAGGFWYVAAQAGAGQLTLGDMVLLFGRSNAGTSAQPPRFQYARHDLRDHRAVAPAVRLSGSGPAGHQAPSTRAGPASPHFAGTGSCAARGQLSLSREHPGRARRREHRATGGAG